MTDKEKRREYARAYARRRLEQDREAKLAVVRLRAQELIKLCNTFEIDLDLEDKVTTYLDENFKLKRNIKVN